MRNLILNSIHFPKIHPASCAKKYPWGWMSQYTIIRGVNKHERDPNMYDSYDSFDSEDFKKGCAQAYITIFDQYKNGHNFLDKSYCSPALSIALNELRGNTNLSNLKLPKIKTIRIIDNWELYERTMSNTKYLGLVDKKELELEMLQGMLGPEEEIYIPLKHQVKVHFACNNRHDIWILERDLNKDDSDWQVCNINQVLLL